MYSARGKTWRSRLFDAPARPAARAPESPVATGVGPAATSLPRIGGQRVWAFLCPNPLCDTELVVFPDHSGELVQCPTCGFEFTAPRVVPIQIVAEEEVARPPLRVFAPGAVMARPAAPPAPFPSPTSPSANGPPMPETKQAAAALDTLASGIPLAPLAPQPPETPEAPRPPRAPGTGTAADALEALARAAAQPGAHPAPPRVERRDTPRANGRPARRTAARANLAPSLPETPTRSPSGKKRADLVLTWVVAVVVSVGLGLAAWIVKVPDLALGSILFIGLAGLRTFLVAGPERADRPPG